MAYAVKYLFKFQSSNGTVREIRVLKDGYSGSVIQRPLGRAPVIKKEKNGGVHGTSLTFYAECHIDREYIEFYTSDPKEYRVDVYAGSTLLWQGYITPELYSEPDIAPPYDVQVVATDGVGELKLYDFAPQGTVTLRALLAYLLGYTGLTTDVNLVSSLKPGSRGAGALLDMQICVDYLAGKTCYEALTYILTTLHATITRWGGAWVLVRETNVTFTGDKVRYFNTSGNSALLTGSVQTLGAMRAAPAWPVGQLSTVIDPAKNKVVVQAPWHPVSGLDNSGMTSDTGWTKDKNARYDTDGYVLPTNVLTPVSETAVISQAVSLVGLRVALSISVKATGSTSEIAGQTYGALMGVFVTYKVGNVTYYLIKGEDGAPAWEQGDNIGTYVPPRTRVDYQQTLSVWDASRIEAEELKIDNIPPFLSGTSFPSGTLTVYILGSCVKVYGAYLDVMLPKGYQDVLRIDNGARGEGDSVEIAIGRVTSEVAYYQSFLQGLLLDTGSIITAFSDANFTTAMDYLALISRDYALSAALPRALAKGTVYLESSIGMPPLVFAKGGLNYWLETWSWDLYEDELEIDARTLPSASLTVQSETILESDGSTVSSSSSGSSGGGSSISPGGGVTYFEPHNDGIILKADYEYVSVPDVLLGDDEESLNALLAVIAGNAVQGAAAYGYFSNGVLPYNHGGTGISSYTKGDLLYASANNTLAKLAANSTGTKKFLTMTSSVPSWDGIAFGDLPTLYWADVAVSSSSSTTAEPTVKSITIGGATLTWVAPVGTTPGYLRINSPLLTDGDQIVGSGTPGGGGGGGASYLYELKDFQSGQSKATTTGTMLMYQATGITDVGGNTGAWKYASPSDVATAIGLGDYLPLSAGSGKSLTGALYVGGTFGDKVVLQTASGGDAWCNVIYQPSSGKNWSVGAGADTFYWYRYGGDVTNGTVMSLDRSGYLTVSGGETVSANSNYPLTVTNSGSGGTSLVCFYKSTTRCGWLGFNGQNSPVYVDGLTGNNAYTLYHTGNFNPGDYLPLAGGNMTGVVWRKMNADTSNYENAIGFKKKADNTVLATIGYHNTVQKVFINPIGSSEVYSDAVGKYSLVIGNNSLTYNTYSIYHAGNFVAGTNYVTPATTLAGYGITDWLVKFDATSTLASMTTSGVYRVGTQSDIPASKNYGNLLVIRGSSTSDTLAQVYFCYNNDIIYFRRGTTSNFTSNSWLQLYHTGNANKNDVEWACSVLRAGYQSVSINTGRAAVTIVSTGDYPNDLVFGSNSVAHWSITSRDSSSSNRLALYSFTASAYIATVTHTGNIGIGIGNADASYKLDVSGQIRASYTPTSTTGNAPLISTNGFSGNNHPWLTDFMAPNLAANYMTVVVYGKAHSTNNAASLSFMYAGSGSESNFTGLGFYANDNLLRVYPTGLVSIHPTTGRNYNEGIRIHEASDGYCAFMFCGSDNTGETGTSTYSWGIFKNTTGNLYINRNASTGATAYLLCNVSGNWGFGTASPAYKLDVNSGSVGDAIRLTSTTTYSCVIYTPSGSGKNWSVGANNSGQFYFYTNSATRAHFTQAGALVTTGDQTISSDLSLKTNLAPVTYGVEDIAKTRAVTFDWKDGRGHSAGSIAQDWKPLIPELVHGEEGDMTLAYGQIALVNSILLARKSESHEERIKELEARVAELEMENERLRMN